jgi:hypothetical protein
LIDNRLVDENKQLVALADNRHDSILKALSSAVTTNVQTTLDEAVRMSIEKSVLPVVESTTRESIDHHMTKTIAAALENSVSKELHSAVQETVTKALLDSGGNLKFSDSIIKSVVSNLEGPLQKEISIRLEKVVKKELGPMLAKIEERLEASLEKGIQKIQEAQRASQKAMTAKFERLVELIETPGTFIQSDSSKGTLLTKYTPQSRSQEATPKEKMAEQFKNGHYSNGIEIVPSLTIMLRFSGQIQATVSNHQCSKFVLTTLFLF